MTVWRSQAVWLLSAKLSCVTSQVASTARQQEESARLSEVIGVTDSMALAEQMVRTAG